MLLHILILHQTTTSVSVVSSCPCCFIFWFYIKPQRLTLNTLQHHVASYFDSTSNHNMFVSCEECAAVASYFDSTSNHNQFKIQKVSDMLLHILILHQTTTITLKFFHHGMLLHILILHQTTTNCLLKLLQNSLLHILILHQTTTHSEQHFLKCVLLHILILHQTTTQLTDCCFGGWLLHICLLYTSDAADDSPPV